MNWRSRKTSKPSRKRKNGLVYQSVSISTENEFAGYPPHFTAVDSKKGEIGEASLMVVDENLQEIQAVPLDLGELPQTWGSEQNLVDHWINDPALEGVHTRIWRDPNGYYLIADQQSRLGTWVNFAPIPTDGVTLMHGDIIQIGEIRYRFIENPPRSIWQAEVQPYNYT